MVRALAGDSTMTRFFDTAGSVAPGPARTLMAGIVALAPSPERWHSHRRLGTRAPRSEAEPRDAISPRFPRRSPATPSARGSHLADASEEVLVDLEVVVVERVGGRRGRRHDRDGLLDLDLQLRADQRPGRDLHEPDVLVREEE